ncbi:hypothetical protein [Novosphingobium sp.]|uniref:hypothetical protein n=1 Tax=Novosphingobium sp. TaxID=1874826 RepID=UPI002B49E998|nr:hypothetical protein [Novosphingobium sp.]HKR92647.1 hypothetical protein [Novosphingobium sp.]
MIGDDEIIHRASFDPMHVHPKKGTLKNSFIKGVDLLKGELSVWRQSEASKCSANDIADIIATPDGNSLWGLHGASAAAIRSLISPDDHRRLFCVVDETETNDRGGHHPAHAHIRFCQHQLAKIEDTSSDLFIHAREQLIQLLSKSGLGWARPNPTN